MKYYYKIKSNYLENIKNKYKLLLKNNKLNDI
jgi:hypothetical protein